MRTKLKTITHNLMVGFILLFALFFGAVAVHQIQAGTFTMKVPSLQQGSHGQSKTPSHKKTSTQKVFRVLALLMLGIAFLFLIKTGFVATKETLVVHFFLLGLIGLLAGISQGCFDGFFQQLLRII